MKLATHIGYDVYDLEESISFYTEIMGAKVDFINKQRKSASLLMGRGEVNLFERKDFAGYHKSILKSLHIGFQVEEQSIIDEIYKRAKKDKSILCERPSLRFDGDYTLFIQDRDGMQLEVYYGTHHLERTK